MASHFNNREIRRTLSLVFFLKSEKKKTVKEEFGEK